MFRGFFYRVFTVDWGPKPRPLGIHQQPGDFPSGRRGHCDRQAATKRWGIFSMDFLWIYMDFIWILYGFSVDFLWIFCGFYMDFLWIFCGFSVDFVCFFFCDALEFGMLWIKKWLLIIYGSIALNTHFSGDDLWWFLMMYDDLWLMIYDWLMEYFWLIDQNRMDEYCLMLFDAAN